MNIFFMNSVLEAKANIAQPTVTSMELLQNMPRLRGSLEWKAVSKAAVISAVSKAAVFSAVSKLKSTKTKIVYGLLVMCL